MKFRPGRTAAALAGILLFAARANATPAVCDPIEPVNRGIFWFNDKLDVYFFEPVAKGWRFVVPNALQKSIGNFFQHLRFPVNAANNLLQGKPLRAGVDVARFGVNTLIGFFGTLDPAAEMGLEESHEDFGQTLGVWGVPMGPYLVLPLIGPSCVRDGGGLIVDSFTAVYPLYLPAVYTLSARTIDTVNYRAQNIEEIRNLKESTFDFYLTVRDGYAQRRRALVGNGAGMSEEEEHELYYGDYD